MLKIRFIQLGITFAFLITLSGCTVTHQGMITAPQSSSPNDDIVVVDKVFGYSRANYIFGLGGWHSQGLANQSMKNLMLSVDLNEGHFLENLTYDMRTDWTFFPLFLKREALISADLVQSASKRKVAYSDEYMEFTEIPISSKNDNNFFKINEKVGIYKGHSFSIEYAKVVAFGLSRLGLVKVNEFGRYRVQFYGMRKNVFRLNWEKDEVVMFSSGESTHLKVGYVDFHRLDNAKVKVIVYNPLTKRYLVRTSNNTILKVKETSFDLKEE